MLHQRDGKVFVKCIVQAKHYVLWGLCLYLCCSGPYRKAHAIDLDTLMDRIQHTYDQTPAFTAEFVQISTLTSLQRQQSSSGRVYIAKPHAIRWEYAQPEAQTILYDGTVLRIYTPKRRQLLQSVIDETQRSNVALLFLAGVGNLRDTFIVTPLPSTESGLAHLRLSPRSTQASFTELHLIVNTENYFVERLFIHDTIGNTTEIRFLSPQISASLPTNTFEFTPPPGTEILTPTHPTEQR
jgi:outer membrane lipoprotein carrier protein